MSYPHDEIDIRDPRPPKKRRKPLLRFQFGTVVFIWFITFLSCFLLYLFAANLMGGDPDADRLEAPVSSASDSLTDPTEADSTAPTDAAPPESTESTPPPKQPIVNPVPASDARSATYFNDCVFVGDSITVGLSNYQLVPANVVYASIGMNLSRIMTEALDTPFGKVTALDALKQAKPPNVYVMLGSNGIAWLTQESMLAQYQEFINAVAAELPDSRIFVLSIPPVTAGREVAAENKITNASIDAYNSALLALANEKGYYYVDVNTALKGNDGKLPNANASDDGIHFKKATYVTLTDYILTHTAL